MVAVENYKRFRWSCLRAAMRYNWHNNMTTTTATREQEGKAGERLGLRAGEGRALATGKKESKTEEHRYGYANHETYHETTRRKKRDLMHKPLPYLSQYHHYLL